jgi:putative ubiquitin-RnfH superfamily antitoxin RatB of RatAB toxin-antitoxin module
MTLRVTVARASPSAQDVVELELRDGATVADAIEACDALARAGVDASRAGYAIHGQTARPATPLADGDRVEITRPLVADTKAVRRDRAKSHPLPGARPGRRKA